MAGLVTAARLRELGREAIVVEKGSRVGGSMLLSSGVVWRHGSLDDFREDCPGGDAALQALVVERLDDALDWLESLGAPVVARETGNPLTVGRRFDPRGLTECLLRAVDEVQLGTSLGEPEGEVVLATGGWGVRLAAERGLALRAAPWSDGGGIAFACRRGAALSSGRDEFYGRLMPAPPARWGEDDFVRGAQLYGRWARAVDDDGRRLFEGEPAWHETDLAQALARVSAAWLVVDDADLDRPVRERTVSDLIAVADELGGEVRREDGATAVRVCTAVTHTIGGLCVDARARVLGEDGRLLEGLHACGADAGGIFTGGYGSGLAAALVLGLAAADDIAG